MITKFSKNYNFNKIFKIKWFFLVIIFIIGFTAGAAGIRYDYIKNAYYFLKDFPNLARNISYIFNRKFSKAEEVSIDIKFDQYQIIVNNRQRNIEEGHAVYTKKDWAKGKILFSNNEKKLNAKFRLKGTMSDNWIDSNGKWSFRVKMSGDNLYDGMKEFTLFKPSVGSGILEWIFQKIINDEGLLGLKTKFVKLNLNGKYLGYYYLQEFYSKTLIESNNRREGPIVGYEKERLVKLWYSDPKQSLETNGFEVADLGISGNYNKLKSEQKVLVKHAIRNLDKLRNGEIAPSKIIDIELISKLIAIRAIIASSDLDWKDIKFYYNPLSSKLEPIAREAHAEYDLFDWWYRGTRALNTINVDHTTFEDLIFSDELIYSRYIYYLKKYMSEDIIEGVKKVYKKDYNSIMSNLALTNDGEKWLEKINLRKLKIKAAFSYPDPISVNLLDDKYLSVRNFQNFPIIIKDILINDKKINSKNYDLIIQGKINDEKFYESLVDVNLPLIKDEDILKITYTLNYDGKLINSNVNKFYIKIEDEENLEVYKNFFEKKNNELHNKETNMVIDQSIITPSHLKVVISPGSTIKFKSKGQLILLGGIEINGNKDLRVTVESSIDADNGGILVLETDNVSTVNYTDFYNLKGVNVPGKLVTGCINFFKTKVNINNSSFYNNLNKDDYINIINSNFNIENITIYDSFADSIDIDFSNGDINNINIFNSGNDGIDFSGSEVNLNNVYIEKSKDKALSVGENSKIKAKSIFIKDSFIGIAAKDGAYFNAEIAEMEGNRFDYASFIKKIEYGSPKISISEGPEKFNYILGKRSEMDINGKLINENEGKITNNIKELLYN